MRESVIDCLFSPEAGRSSACADVSGCAESSASMLARMDAAGIDRVLLSACKRWKCERHWICGEIQVDEVLQYVNAAPDRFAALASYNPYEITASLQQVEHAIKLQDVRGAYVHTDGSDVGLRDRRMYPLYARLVALAKPVMIQVGAAGSPFGVEELSKIAADFPELTIVATWSGALDVTAAQALFAERPGVYAAFDVRPAGKDACEWLQQDGVAERCMWGSNGESWDDLRQTLPSLPLNETTCRKYFRDTAIKVFELGRASARPMPPVIDIAVAE